MYEGYTYAAGYDNNGSEEILRGNIAGDGSLVLKVYYAANPYSISYNANTGTGDMTDTGVYFNENATLSTNAFARTGYTFVGWNTEANGTGIPYEDGYVFTYNISDDLTLYAQWTPNYAVIV